MLIFVMKSTVIFLYKVNILLLHRIVYIQLYTYIRVPVYLYMERARQIVYLKEISSSRCLLKVWTTLRITNQPAVFSFTTKGIVRATGHSKLKLISSKFHQLRQEKYDEIFFTPVNEQTDFLIRYPRERLYVIQNVTRLLHLHKILFASISTLSTLSDLWNLTRTTRRHHIFIRNVISP